MPAPASLPAWARAYLAHRAFIEGAIARQKQSTLEEKMRNRRRFPGRPVYNP